MDLDQMLIDLGQQQGSDLHLKVGRPPLFRISGDLVPQTGYPEITPEDMREMFLALLGPERLQHFEQTLEADFSYEIPGYARFRVNGFVQRGHLGAVMRLIPLEVPTIDGLGLPPVLKTLCDHPNGLIVVTGPTGAGKSTTLAAMIQYLNEHYPKHIVTIEDPIEFVYTDELSTINQRELGLDTLELFTALRAVLRQDPDIILMGEMRDADTIHFGISAAETGHLVLSTLHTNDAKQTLDRILDTFEGTEANQVRMQLSMVLRGVICQRLCKRAGGVGLVPAIEILVNTGHVSQLIAESNTRDLQKAMEQGSHYQMQTFNQSLHALYRAGLITREEAMSKSSAAEDLELMIRGIRRGASTEEQAYVEESASGPEMGLRPTGRPSGKKKKPKFGRGFEF